MFGAKDRVIKQIADKVYKEVGDKILKAQREVLDKRDKEMCDIIDKFDHSTREAVKEIIEEEFDKRVRAIVVDEIKKEM